EGEGAGRHLQPGDAARCATAAGVAAGLSSAGSRPDAQARGDVVTHDAAECVLWDRGEAQRGGLLVDGRQLAGQLGRIVEKTGVVSPEEDLLRRHERGLAPVLQ